MHMGGTLAPGNIRWQPELGGGTVADIGCYLINVARWAGGTEPVQVTAVWQEYRTGGVDSRVGLLLGFPGAVVATLFGALDTMLVRDALLAGSGRRRVRPHRPDRAPGSDPGPPSPRRRAAHRRRGRRGWPAHRVRWR